MRNLAARLTLTLIMLASATLAPSAQTRPRRVGQNAPATSPSSAPAPTTADTTPRHAPRMERPAPRAERTSTPQAPNGEVAEEVGEDEVVRVNAALVTVPVSVLDRDGRFIGGLRKEDFRIQEDGVEQQVAYFAPVEQPFTVALVIDTSGSTRFKLEDIQEAALAFVDQLRPDDRVTVVSFDDEVRVLSEVTNDRRALRDAIRRTRPGQGTRLYDAVDLVIKRQLSREKGRKAIVLFTDGVDTSSKQANYQSTLADAEELDAMIYPIQYDTSDYNVGGGGGGGGRWPGPNRNPRRRNPGWGDVVGIILGGGVTVGNGGGGGGRGGGRRGGGGGGGGAGSSPADYSRAGEYLRRLAEQTGGRHHDAADLRYVGEAFTNIAEELRRQYSLGYYPSRQSQAIEQRRIKVRVRRPNLVVRARDSYVYRPDGSAPGPNSTTAQDTNARPSQPVLRPRNFDAERGGLKE